MTVTVGTATLAPAAAPVQALIALTKLSVAPETTCASAAGCSCACRSAVPKPWEWTPSDA